MLEISRPHGAGSSPDQPPSTTISELPTEVLLLVFEDIYSASSPFVSSLRLVSRRFNNLAIPLFYRHIKLNEPIFECFLLSPKKTSELQTRIATSMRMHTLEITITEHFDPASLTSLLASLKVLQQVNWHVWSSSSDIQARSGNSPFQEALPPILKGKCPRYRLCIGSNDRDFPASWMSFDNPPSVNLVSLKCYDVQLDYHMLFPRFLASCRQLKVLHVYGTKYRGSTYRAFNEHFSCRTAPLEELVLKDVRWIGGSQIAVKFWDLSQIKCLELKRCTVLHFAKHLDRSEFQHLRILTLVGKRLGDGYLLDLAETLLSVSSKLEKVTLVRKMGQPPRQELWKHGPTLQTVDLRNLGNEFHLYAQALSVDYLQRLAPSLPNLMELTFEISGGFDVGILDHYHFFECQSCNVIVLPQPQRLDPVPESPSDNSICHRTNHQYCNRNR